MIAHDEENIFISGYRPDNSQSFGVVVKSNEINRLLAPNSVELEAPRSPPVTHHQLYERLIELVKLERPRQTIVGARPSRLSLSCNAIAPDCCARRGGSIVLLLW